jgi:hypothetical protein
MAAPAYFTDLANINAGAEATTNWALTGGSAIAADGDNVLQGTNCLACKVSTTTNLSLYDYYTANGNTVLDASSKIFIAWMAVLKQAIVDSFANGGVRMYVEDGESTPRWASWDVAGKDTLPNQGWQAHVIHTASTTNRRVGGVPWSVANSGGDGGAAPDFTKIRKVGVILKTTGATTGNTKNFFWDVFWMGTHLGVKRGDGSTKATWEGLSAESDAQFYGAVQKRGGVYFLNTNIRIGSTTAGEDTLFQDSGKTVIFRDNNVGDAFLQVLLQGNATAGTTFQLGSVVGSGDDRQGVQGGTIASAAKAWLFDAQTNIANLTNVYLYGVNFSLAKRGVLLDDGNKTSVVSCAFVNCGEIHPGTVNTGAEILSCAIIDPTDSVSSQNRGLRFPNQPTHKVKKVSFITSGTPTTQHLVHLTPSADYSIGFDAIKFFGSYASATIQHGENSGTNADVTISPTNGANPIGAEFSNTAGGTVTVSNPSVTTTVNVKDHLNGNLLGARVYLKAANGTGPMPYQDGVAIARASTTATVTHTSHGMETGDRVVIKGITDKTEDNNGTHSITVTGADTYTYATTDSGSTSYQGSITSTWVAIDTTTDSGGNVTRTKSYTSSQPVDGWVRKSTDSPRYKNAPIPVSTITTSGDLTINLKMVLDE